MPKPQANREGKSHVESHKPGKTLSKSGKHIKEAIDVHNKPTSKQDMKQRKRARKGKLYACDMTEVLEIYEKVRQKGCDNRVELLEREIDLLERNLASAAVSRTESRILQLVFEYGSDEEKKAVFAGIRDTLLDICREKYGRHLGIAALTENSEYADTFIKEQIIPVLPKLCGEVYSLEVITNIAVNSKKFEHIFLQALFEDPEQISGVVSIACSKDLLGSTFIHKVLKQHLDNIAAEKYLPKGNTEEADPNLIIEEIADEFEPLNFLQLISSNEGVYSAALFYEFETAKEKQKILNESKKQLQSMMKDQSSRHFIAYAMLNTDDTRFISEFLADVIKGSCGDFCEFVLLSGLECLSSGHFALNGALSQQLYTKIVDRNKKSAEVRFEEIKAYFSPAMDAYTEEPDKVRKLILERMDNYLFLELLKMEDIVEMFCSNEKEEPLFKHNVAHYALKQYLKKQGNSQLCSLFLERFETLPEEVFTRRGCNVLMMLEALDKHLVHTFVRTYLRDNNEKWIRDIIESE